METGPKQTRVCAEPWIRNSSYTAVLTTATTLVLSRTGRVFIDNIIINNTASGGSLNASVGVLPSGGTLKTFVSLEAVANNARLNLPTVNSQGPLLVLQAGDALQALGSATGLNALVNYRIEG